MSEAEKQEDTFTTRDFLEELTTIYTERSDFLRTKLAKHSIGEIEANLYRYRLGRLKAAGELLRSIHETEKSARRDGAAAAPADNSASEKLKWFIKMQETAVELIAMGKPVTAASLLTFLPFDAVPNREALCEAVASSAPIAALLKRDPPAAPEPAPAPVEVIDDGFDDV